MSLRHQDKPIQNADQSAHKDGYTVVAYDFNNDVFYKGDATYLPELIHEVVEDISKVIDDYKRQGITDIGFFSTSLGAFVLYQAIAKIPDFSWGILNTGGDIAAGIWKIKRANQAFTKNDYTLQKLQAEWHPIQYPKFETRLQNTYFIFVGSDHDSITPLNKLRDLADYIHRQSGASTEVVKVVGFGHSHTALIGLTRARALIRKADLGSKAQRY